ncbi:hypothetical protein EMIT0P176_270007 [Pseudomonas sp. IT-P176]
MSAGRAKPAAPAGQAPSVPGRTGPPVRRESGDAGADRIRPQRAVDQGAVQNCQGLESLGRGVSRTPRVRRGRGLVGQPEQTPGQRQWRLRQPRTVPVRRGTPIGILRTAPEPLGGRPIRRPWPGRAGKPGGGPGRAGNQCKRRTLPALHRRLDPVLRRPAPPLSQPSGQRSSGVSGSDVSGTHGLTGQQRLARENLKYDACIQAARVIVDDHREQARSHNEAPGVRRICRYPGANAEDPPPPSKAPNQQVQHIIGMPLQLIIIGMLQSFIIFIINPQQFFIMSMFMPAIGMILHIMLSA